MATGAASQLAAPAGVGVLRGPLLWVTIAIAVGITAAGVFFGPRLPRRWPRRAAATRFGDFTVPIGLAVIGSGLAGLRGPAPAAGAIGTGAIGTGAIGTGAIGTGAIGTGAIGTGVAATSAIVVVTLAWAATGVLVATVLVPVAAGWPGLGAVGGAWFLAPAALLADATGTAAVASKVAGQGPALGWLAVVVAGMGAVSYLMVLGLAIARFAAHGLSGAPLSPWWVAAGCGGLSAAVLGRVSAVGPGGQAAATLREFGWAALVFWAAGSVVAVFVLAGSARYVARLRRLAGRPPWPPTFSTGVYALGAAQVGRLLGVPWIARFAGVAAAATLGLWALTLVLHFPRVTGRLFRRNRPAQASSDDRCQPIGEAR
jgi:hypothetical protein